MLHHAASGRVQSIKPAPAVDAPSNAKSQSKVLSALDASGALHLAQGERWYVVYTQRHRELRAQTQLFAQGFRSFLPRHRKTVRHARQLRDVSAAFFPRYLFVALDLERDRWRSVNGTFGVSRLLMGEERPRPVAPGMVEGLIAATGSDGHLKLGDGLVIGQRVRVRLGPFADLMGELARIDAGGRVQILLQCLGGTVPVCLNRDALTAADQAA